MFDNKQGNKVNEAKGQNQLNDLDRNKSLLEEAHCSLEHKYDIFPLITKNSDVFATSDLELGQTDTVTMKIETGDVLPLKKTLFYSFDKQTSCRKSCR